MKKYVTLGFAIALGSSFAPPVFGQSATKPSGTQIYQWRDSNGRLVVSDRPPLPDGRVTVKQSEVPIASSAGSGVRLAVTPSPDASKAATSATKTKPSAEELTKKAEAEARKKETCEAAQTELRTLQSGIRIAQVNAQGEREFMSDEAKAKRVATVNRDLAELCKG